MSKKISNNQWITIKELKISLDGDKFCCLIGEDIQSGNAGFGDTIPEAFANLLKDLEKLLYVPEN
jgi:hypothetical protein